MKQSGYRFFDRTIHFRNRRLTNFGRYARQHHRSRIGQNRIHAFDFKMMQSEFIMFFHTSITLSFTMKKRCQNLHGNKILDP